MRYLILLLLLFQLVSCRSNKQFQAQTNQIVQLDGLNIEYTIRGKGPVMIVGHLNSGKIAYEKSLKPLEEWFTMVYYNPRGTGNSEAPKTINEYGYSFIVAEIEALRKQLDVPQIWLWGHSDQSEIALEYAIDYPDQTAGLILTGTHYVADQATERQEKKAWEKERIENSKWFQQICADWDYKIKHKTDIDSSGRDLSFAPIKWWCYDSLSAEKVIPLYEAINQAGRRKAIEEKQPFTSTFQRNKLFDRIYEYQQKYSTIKAKILILQGYYDSYNPPEMTKKLHQQLPTSELIFIEKAGHFPWVEQPEESLHYIEHWLEEL